MEKISITKDEFKKFVLYEKMIKDIRNLVNEIEDKHDAMNAGFMHRDYEDLLYQMGSGIIKIIGEEEA